PLTRRVLVAVPSLAPRRRGAAASARLRRSLLPSRRKHALSLRGLALSRLPLRSLTLRPGHSLTILLMAWSMGSRGSVSFRPAIQATGRLALVPVGLLPTEHVCLWIARPLQPEARVHFAVHRQRGLEVFVGLGPVTQASVEHARAEVAVGDEGAHAELV